MKKPEQKTASLSANALVKSVNFYQMSMSPAFGRRCRYLPTCSAYAKTAIERYGAWKGASLAGRRLLRCHPFGSSGFDPVPCREHGVKSC